MRKIGLRSARIGLVCRGAGVRSKEVVAVGFGSHNASAYGLAVYVNSTQPKLTVGFLSLMEGQLVLS
ncbi:hypothetical protein TUM17387_24920 [Shewanella carassii]|nr:hypothetical protein TUM17387_24920 [Shewanella carassii]